MDEDALTPAQKRGRFGWLNSLIERRDAYMARMLEVGFRLGLTTEEDEAHRYFVEAVNTLEEVAEVAAQDEHLDFVLLSNEGPIQTIYTQNQTSGKKLIEDFFTPGDVAAILYERVMNGGDWASELFDKTVT